MLKFFVSAIIAVNLLTVSPVGAAVLDEEPETVLEDESVSIESDDLEVLSDGSDVETYVLNAILDALIDIQENVDSATYDQLTQKKLAYIENLLIMVINRQDCNSPYWEQLLSRIDTLTITNVLVVILLSSNVFLNGRKGR